MLISTKQQNSSSYQEMTHHQETKINARHRIIRAQTEILSQRFYEFMNRHYQAVVIHHERCKLRIVRQIQLGFDRLM